MIKIYNTIINHKIKLIIVIVLLAIYYFSLPRQLFKAPTATVVNASNQELLGAVIADDGQWRFPEIDSVPVKFKHCITQYEDAYFYKHIGFNPISILKAFVQNIEAGKTVRGGSTLTQQVIRLSRKNKKRTYFEKLKELILATRLEFRESKENILKLYASHAPYGGNVVGLEMASWRYFRLKPYQLSWAESATLAVLPNAPSLIYPGKNQERLKVKRNKLLKKIYKKGTIDSITYSLAIEEELPQKPNLLPEKAPHFVQKISKEKKGKRIISTIDYHLQEQVNNLAKQHYYIQKQNEVYNLSILVLDVETRNILAYVGNSPTDKAHQKDVDNVLSGRSTGSILKPLLYAQMLNDGTILPKQLVADIPTEIVGYSPKNYNLSYDGAVPMNEALTRSLNIPMVRNLQIYGLEKFREDLELYHITHINKSADHYGLPLILGGAEASLWDMCKVYAGYAGIVNHYETLKHNYYEEEFIEPNYQKNNKNSFGKIIAESNTIDVGSAYTTLNTLTEVNRTETDQAWKYYDSSKKVGWKTGTSFGNKDAWAIGVTKKYVVGVWIGNSDGEGRPNLTGVGSASPLMFNVFNLLPKSDWFLEPYEDMIEEKICKQSGFLALPICPSEVKRIPKNTVRGKSCKYHEEILLDDKQQFRVNRNCVAIENSVQKIWFTLPPLMAYYYKQKHTDYKKLPDFKKGCNIEKEHIMSFIFPSKKYTKISLTKGVTGQINPVILKLTHVNQDAKVFWYINSKYVRETEAYHEIALTPEIGIYAITVTDNLGNELKTTIEVF